MKKIKVDIIGSGVAELTKDGVVALADCIEYMTDDSNIEGTIHTPVAYAQDAQKLRDRFDGLTLNADIEGIKFADPEVERVLLASTNPKIDTNNDGVISIDEAESATSLPSFANNTNIENFEEFRFFKKSSLPSFSGCTNLRVIGNGIFPNITVLSVGMFMRCVNLNQRLEFPNATYVSGVGTLAEGSGITEIIAPKITSFPDTWGGGRGCFAEMIKLKRVEVGKLTYIPYALFYNCQSLEEFPDMSAVTAINANAFFNTRTYNRGLVIPNCTAIEGTNSNSQNKAFMYSGIKFVSAPKLKNIGSVGGYFSNGDGCMSHVNLKFVHFQDIETILTYAFSQSVVNRFIIDRQDVPSGITNNSLINCNVGAIYVPSGGIDVFKDTLTSYASKIFAIGGAEYQAAAQSAADEEGVTPDLLLSHPYVFENIYGGVKGLGGRTFFKDYEVGRVLKANNLIANEDGYADGELEGITTLPSFANNTQIEYFDEMGMVTRLGALPDFKGSTIKSIVFPNSITQIRHTYSGQGTFFNCTNLESVEVSDNLQLIGGYAFQNCASLHFIDLKNVTTLKNYSFIGSGVRKVVAKRVSSVENGVFQSCGNVFLYFGNSISDIGSSFARYDTLTMLIDKDGVPTINSTAWTGCGVNAIYVRQEHLDDYKSAATWSVQSSRFRGFSKHDTLPVDNTEADYCLIKEESLWHWENDEWVMIEDFTTE